jgi:hypothetical protein
LHGRRAREVLRPQDRNDPVAMADAQERRLPHVNARYYPDEDGHLIFYSRIDEILTQLAARV